MVLVVVSAVTMLRFMSPELQWDEADYAANAGKSWSFLWSTFDYSRHAHGPLGLYLAKLGETLLPAGMLSVETRLRGLIVLVASLSAGIVYWGLRCCAHTSRAAAVVGATLLSFNVIRVLETPVMGPHHLMLVCTVAMLVLGFRWRSSPTLSAAVALGAIAAYGALSMTYIVPAMLAWGLAVTFAGRGWVVFTRTQVGISWMVAVVAVVALLLLELAWPPSVLQRAFINDFKFYLHYPPFATLVGDRIFQAAPRSAWWFWLTRLDAPLLVMSVVTIGAAVWNGVRRRTLSSKHAYLAICLGVYLAAALTAHMAGARNLLQVAGVLCVVVGALFDETFIASPLVRNGVTAVVMLVAAGNLVLHAESATYVPFVATDGYRAFLREEKAVAAEHVSAIVAGDPVLQFYAKETNTPLNWTTHETGWNTRANIPVRSDAKYALIQSSFDYMPPDQPMRRVIAAQWKLIWSYQPAHAWALRLYQRPP
jgi:hypothetical protein